VYQSFKLRPDGLLQYIGLCFQHLRDTIAKDRMVDRELVCKRSDKPTGGLPVLLVAREEPACDKAPLGVGFRTETLQYRRFPNASDAVQDIDRYHTCGSPHTEIMEELPSSPLEALTDFAVDDLAVMPCRHRIKQFKESAVLGFLMTEVSSSVGKGGSVRAPSILK
jgi:hypothetical protein